MNRALWILVAVLACSLVGGLAGGLFSAALIAAARGLPGRLGVVVARHPVVFAAFCGLGNPQSFWNTLRDLGLEIAFRWTFSDHHQYAALEIQRLVHQARAHKATFLVTTEKDAINLPPDTERLLGTLPLLWLKVELALTEPEAFFSYLEQAIRH